MVLGGHGLYHADESGGVDLGERLRTAPEPEDRIAAVQPRELLIFGAGGFGREVASWAGRAQWQDRGFEVVAFIDDDAAADRSSTGARC